MTLSLERQTVPMCWTWHRKAEWSSPGRIWFYDSTSSFVSSLSFPIHPSLFLHFFYISFSPIAHLNSNFLGRREYNKLLLECSERYALCRRFRVYGWGCVDGKPPTGKSMVCLADMARTFEYVLHFVRCITVTVSPNLIMIIIIR